MRALLCVLGLMLILSSADTAMGAAKAKGKGKKDNGQGAKTAAIQTAIHDVFTKANKDHNETLSRQEFHRAQGMLQSAAADLVQRGVIGNGKPQGKPAAMPSMSKAPSLGSTDINKSNKISEQEFSLYANNYISEGEQQISQAKAAQAQRNAARSRRYMPVQRGR